MNTLNALAAATALVALPAAAEYRFDVATGTCRDASGRLGLNAGHRGVCGDLRGANLEGENLAGVDLSGARLDGAKLVGANLSQATLFHASLDNADLTRATLTGARLDRASLLGAKLVSAHLEHARLDAAFLAGADLRNACLYRTHFAGADLRSAMFSQSRSMLWGARFRKALVDAATLPMSLEELAGLQVNVSAAVVSRN